MGIVVLGARREGKSSSGNTILGREESDTVGRTAECVKREGETAGRHITLVEAPGWWKNYTVAQTPERDKREIILSVSLCPPGPHALLLVIDVSESFTKTFRRAVQEHLELLGERVWSHTIVQFTRGDWLGDTSIEQHIESGGEALQWVVEKCGNRYHVVDNKKSDGGQVTELLEKIEEMVAGNKGCPFLFKESKEFPPNFGEPLPDAGSGSRSGQSSVFSRFTSVLRRSFRRSTQSSGYGTGETAEGTGDTAGGVPQISDMRIVMLGNRAAGKSSSGNTILGREEFDTVGRTAECVKREGETAGRHITLVEAPGWWKNYTIKETPERDKQEIILSVSLCPPGPHALLLVIRVDNSFTETHRRGVQEHLELMGERVWSHTIVLFTRGDCLGDTSIEQHIESGGETLQWLVEKCGNRYHIVDNKKSDGGQVTELLEKIEEMVAGNKGCPFLLKRSCDSPPNFRESLPGHSFGNRSEQCSVLSRFELKRPLVAASTQSSGYGTGEMAEGSGDTASETQINTTHGDDQESFHFVDLSSITVDHNACIGRGSYGTVYKGSYQDTPAAVKIIPIGNTAVITNEFLIPLRLSHPNIVQMLAVAKSETDIFIANEYIHGNNLQEILYKAAPIKLQSKDKLQVALDVTMAVEYVHDKRIIHNDLKAANIMVAADTRKAYLTDWGLAECKETITATTGQLLGGTPSYMAPECLVECEKGSFMSDMWSLGITLLEMFTDSEPWATIKPQEIRKHLHKQQKPHALDKLQADLNDIVKPLLEYEPNARMNAKDLVTLLKTKVDLEDNVL